MMKMIQIFKYSIVHQALPEYDFINDINDYSYRKVNGYI